MVFSEKQRTKKTKILAFHWFGEKYFPGLKKMLQILFAWMPTRKKDKLTWMRWVR